MPNQPRAVLLQTDPVEIGDRLLKSNPLVKARWYDTHAKGVIKSAIRLKFLQNPLLGEVLKKTSGQLIEANPYDNIWGAGLSLKDQEIWDKKS